MSRNVLIVEDNEDIARLVRMHLEELGCSVRIAYDGIVGLSEVQAHAFDLIVLDLMLPGADGLEVCRRVRSQERYTPILMLTAKSSELDRVLGLELGADDYLTKPFSVLEFVARVKAIFRRVENLTAEANKSAKRIVVAGLAVDRDRRTVELDGNPVELTAKEFDLLAYFADHPGRVFTRAQLLDKVWGYSHSGYEHTVNSHINRLRAKIERDPNQPEFIQTVWGVGYKFRDAG